MGGATATWTADCSVSGSPRTEVGRRSIACRSAVVTSLVESRRFASAATWSTDSNSSRTPSPVVAEVKHSGA